MASRAARLPLPASVNTPEERVACPIPRNVPAATVPVTVTVPALLCGVTFAAASARTPSVNQLVSRSATGPAPSWEAVTRSVPSVGVSSAFSSSKVSGKMITPLVDQPGRSAWPPNEGSQHRKFALPGSARAPSCVRGRLRRPCRTDGLQGSVEFAGQGHPAREWPFRSSADGQQTADGLGRRVQLKQDPDPDVVHGGNAGCRVAGTAPGNSPVFNEMLPGV